MSIACATARTPSSPASWSISRKPASIPATRACSLPPHSLDAAIIAELERQTRALALALNVGGLMNVQYAIKDGDIYVLEVNPRASRTVPFVAKVIGLPVAKIAARIMAGETLAELRAQAAARFDHVAVKEAVFPFARFPGVDTVLGPEMNSTGEVMGLDRDFAIAFAKSQLGGGIAPAARRARCSSRCATPTSRASWRRCGCWPGSASRSSPPRAPSAISPSRGVPAEKINKVLEGRPHIVDAIKNGEVQLVFNTTEGATGAGRQPVAAARGPLA